ncbi:subtilisin-like protein [Ramicandelaber brevisporus]|nr:subtilisin-like protein [Ramicandelaber brevisporus]
MVSFKLLAVFAATAAGTVFGLAPLKAAHPDAKVIPGSYIVKFRDGISAQDSNAHISTISGGAAIAASNSRGIKAVWSAALKGYHGTFDAGTLSRIRADPNVEYVEQNIIVHAPHAVKPSDDVSALGSQTNAPWNLARLSSKTSLAGTSGPWTYYYQDADGKGANVYVLDTGIRVTHVEFGGRAVWGANFAGDGQNTDGNGHGTHVAGVVGGKTYGVAKNAKLVAVKVLDASGSGSTANIISGLNWVVTEHKAGRGGAKGDVINMSIGGSLSSALNNAVASALSAGISVATAAGNSAANACNFSPGSTPGVINTVASDINDTVQSSSNFGTCVTIAGPGVNIKSAWITNDSATQVLSGGSMATAHSAGIAAYFISLKTAGFYTPATLKSFILSVANTISSGPGKLLYNNYFP